MRFVESSSAPEVAQNRGVVRANVTDQNEQCACSGREEEPHADLKDGRGHVESAHKIKS